MSDMQLEVGDMVAVIGEKNRYTVRCRDERWVVCTKPYNAHRRKKHLIIDLENQMYGPDNHPYGLYYQTDEQCNYALRLLHHNLLKIRKYGRKPKEYSALVWIVKRKKREEFKGIRYRGYKEHKTWYEKSIMDDAYFKIYAVDFDGTLSLGAKFPECGKPNLPLIGFLKREKAKGNKLILWTCRVDKDLDAAVKWCEGVGLSFDAINENLPEMVSKFGNDCRKVYAHKYIDDASVTPSKLAELEMAKYETGKKRKPRTAIIV